MDIFNTQMYIPQLSIDCVIFGFQKRELKVLISKLSFKGDFYSLPTGYILQNEGIDEAAYRILEDRTGLSDIFLEHFKNFGQPNRTKKTLLESALKQNQENANELLNSLNENREWFTNRFVTLGYYALVDINKVEPKKIELDESLKWYDINQLPEMIMDHNLIVTSALESLRLNLDKNIIIFNLLPDTFTMKEVQDLYETIFDKTYARNNFQKKILELNVLERLEKKFTGASNKAPYLYRFKK